MPMRPTVVLVNADVIDKLGIVVFSAIPVRPPLRGALRVSFRLLSQSCGAAAGNPGAPPPARRSAALGEAAPAHSGGSIPVGLVVRPVERLAVQCLPRPARDGHRLAPEGL